MGDPFAYDVDSALAAARQRSRERGEQRKTEGASADHRYWLTQFPEVPRPERLRRHAERFGAEGIEEIADAYGVDLTATTRARTPKRLPAGKSKRATSRARASLLEEAA
jgi:hypothetical protein